MSLWRPFPFKPPRGPSSVGSYRFCPQNILHTYSSLPSPTPAGFLCEPTGQARQRSKLAWGRGRGMAVFFFLPLLHHVYFSRLTVTSIADYLLWLLLNSAPMPRALSRFWRNTLFTSHLWNLQQLLSSQIPFFTVRSQCLIVHLSRNPQ